MNRNEFNAFWYRRGFAAGKLDVYANSEKAFTGESTDTSFKSENDKRDALLRFGSGFDEGREQVRSTYPPSTGYAGHGR